MYALARVAMTTLVLTLGAGPARAQSSLTFEPYTFGAGDRTVDAEFGRLRVPERRANPMSRTIELAFVRFTSTSPQPGPPIVYLAGGPGASGIAAARGPRFSLFMKMRELGDVIALDQRATGMSTPSTACTERLDYPLDVVGDRLRTLELFRERSSKCVARLRADGADLTGYTIVESADDLESLRIALGAERLRLWAISYGTQLALATMRRYPSRIDRAILAGVEGPEMTIKYPDDVQSHLRSVAAVVRNDDHIGKAVPDLLGLMEKARETLGREPLTVSVTNQRTQQASTVSLGWFDLQWFTAVFMVGNVSLDMLPALYDAIARRDLKSPDVEFWARWVTGARTGPIGSAMQIMIDCSSGVSRERAAVVARQSPATLLGDMVDFPLPGICTAWGNPDLGDEFRTQVRSQVPVLLISGTLDGRCPVSNAEAVRTGFPNSTEIIVEGAVHSDPLFLASSRISEVMAQFMSGKPVADTRIAGPAMAFKPLHGR
jgi:pimeloyl-ACP methyl ester carboxylesterase